MRTEPTFDTSTGRSSIMAPQDERSCSDEGNEIYEERNQPPKVSGCDWKIHCGWPGRAGNAGEFPIEFSNESSNRSDRIFDVTALQVHHQHSIRHDPATGFGDRENRDH